MYGLQGESVTHHLELVELRQGQMNRRSKLKSIAFELHWKAIDPAEFIEKPALDVIVDRG
jgi:hypothetical protein